MLTVFISVPLRVDERGDDKVSDKQWLAFKLSSLLLMVKFSKGKIKLSLPSDVKDRVWYHFSPG